MQDLTETEAKLRAEIVEHILMMKRHDIDYARSALVFYDLAYPHFGLKAGVRDAMKAKPC